MFHIFLAIEIRPRFWETFFLTFGALVAPRDHFFAFSSKTAPKRNVRQHSGGDVFTTFGRLLGMPDSGVDPGSILNDFWMTFGPIWIDFGIICQ